MIFMVGGMNINTKLEMLASADNPEDHFLNGNVGLDNCDARESRSADASIRPKFFWVQKIYRWVKSSHLCINFQDTLQWQS